ncbi:MAG TPA: hypothetical protein VK050_01900 [Flavobacteriaceae bacterium]|nr:hypothetical protein [Flavobacteriaceae bacterium]
MSKKTKIKILSHLVFFVIFIIIWTILHFTYKNLNGGYKAMICGGLTAILAPRIKEYKTQSGKQMQVKWIFLKKILVL